MRGKIISMLAAGGLMVLLSGCSGNKGDTDSEQGQTKDNYTITLTHAVAEDTSQQAGCLAFKEYVEDNSDGRITVNIYPNAQMGGDREQIEGVQEGSITMMACGSAAQANFVNSAIVFDIPFAFQSEEQMEKVFNDQAFLDALSSDYEKAGFHVMGVSSLGFRVTTANKEIRVPEDVRGLTIRTMENKYHMALWKDLGANPTPLAFNELYTALQQGTVEAQENPLELVYAQKFYEQQKYVINTRHLPQDLVWIMNKNFYDRLPAELRQVVDEGAEKAVEGSENYYKKNNVMLEEKTKEAGVTFIDLSVSELEPFAEAAQPVWDDIKADCNETVYAAFMEALETSKKTEQ